MLQYESLIIEPKVISYETLCRYFLYTRESNSTSNYFQIGTSATPHVVGHFMSHLPFQLFASFWPPLEVAPRMFDLTTLPPPPFDSKYTRRAVGPFPAVCPNLAAMKSAHGLVWLNFGLGQRHLGGAALKFEASPHHSPPPWKKKNASRKKFGQKSRPLHNPTYLGKLQRGEKHRCGVV